ncbi:MAG: hypothetical protein R3Y43_05660 [Alphaproteobacteria bacterium]
MKYILIALLLFPSLSYGQNSLSVTSYDNPYNYLMDKMLEKATGEDGQLTFNDYDSYVNNLPRIEKKKMENTSADFNSMDYNNDGLVSRYEFQRFNLNREITRPKSKQDERVVKRKIKQGTYSDPQVEFDAITEKLDEEIRIAEEEKIAKEEELKKEAEKQ